MYCKNCGNNINDNAVVCPNCGVQVGEFKSIDTQKPPADIPQKGNAVGIVGFVTSLVGALFWLISLIVSTNILMLIAIVLDIAGIACSAVGRKRAKKENASFGGLSLAGLIIGIVFISLTVFFLILGVIMLASVGSMF